MKRREPVDSADRETSTDRWLVSYADFITLMFAFFAVLYATSVKDVEKTKDFQESIKKYLIKAGAFGESGAQMNQGTKNNSPIQEPIETFNPARLETSKLLDEAEAFIETNLKKEDRQKFIVDITSDDWGVRIVIPNSALFAAGSDKFKADAVPFIGKLGELLAKTKRKILIEGHVSPKEVGSFKSTWDFASARSVNLVRFIQQKQNMAPSQLASATLADSRPLDASGSPALNSRIEVVLLNPDFEF
jgi:chemotaxis protein MotB